eukprot:scaffold19937_cov127-Isochrysis_galbana.AAC.3
MEFHGPRCTTMPLISRRPPLPVELGWSSSSVGRGGAIWPLYSGLKLVSDESAPSNSLLMATLFVLAPLPAALANESGARIIFVNRSSCSSDPRIDPSRCACGLGLDCSAAVGRSTAVVGWARASPPAPSACAISAAFAASSLRFLAPLLRSIRTMGSWPAVAAIMRGLLGRLSWPSSSSKRAFALSNSRAVDSCP